jgi:hypothetical protein
MAARSLLNSLRRPLVVRLSLCLYLLFGAAACSSEPREAQSLVDHQLWVEVGAADDPFEDRPAVVECSALAFGYDFIGEDSFEVDMGSCNYLTASQPSLVAVESGDSLDFRLWHNGLAGPEGESHVAVTLGGELAWDLRISIPGEAELRSETLVSDFDVAAGAEVLFHIHNHGSNNYNLLDCKVTGS